MSIEQILFLAAYPFFARSQHTLAFFLFVAIEHAKRAFVCYPLNIFHVSYQNENKQFLCSID